MLSYQHAYHAGNHADILKHFVLSFVINSLNKKEKPYTFIDTHSGSGLYDLLDNRSLKTKEAEKGIEKLYEDYKADSKATLFAVPEFAAYFDTVKEYLKNSNYPGSPVIELNLLRSQDTLILSELHPQEYENLANNIKELKTKESPSVVTEHKNGFEVLLAHTPPITKRGAVLIDPSYEEQADYTDVAKAVKSVLKKWSNGIIMLWYPLLAHREEMINDMKEQILDFARSINQNIETADLQLCVADKDSHVEVSLKEVLSDEDKKNPPRLYGSGMLVINAPWHLKECTENLIPEIQKLL